MCEHKNKEEITEFGDRAQKWMCADCGEVVEGPGTIEDEDVSPMQGEVHEMILEVLIEIRDLLISLIGGKR